MHNLTKKQGTDLLKQQINSLQSRVSFNNALALFWTRPLQAVGIVTELMLINAGNTAYGSDRNIRGTHL